MVVSPWAALKSGAVSVPEPPPKWSAPFPPVSLSLPLPPHMRSFAPRALSVSEPFLAKIIFALSLPVRKESLPRRTTYNLLYIPSKDPSWPWSCR